MDDYIECPECGGEGTCEYEVAKPDWGAPRGGELVGVIMECEVCGGSGEILAEEDDQELFIDVTLDNTGSLH